MCRGEKKIILNNHIFLRSLSTGIALCLFLAALHVSCCLRWNARVLSSQINGIWVAWNVQSIDAARGLHINSKFNHSTVSTGTLSAIENMEEMNLRCKVITFSQPYHLNQYFGDSDVYETPIFVQMSNQTVKNSLLWLWIYGGIVTYRRQYGILKLVQRIFGPHFVYISIVLRLHWAGVCVFFFLLASLCLPATIISTLEIESLHRFSSSVRSHWFGIKSVVKLI